jgi:hypothetical protein
MYIIAKKSEKDYYDGVAGTMGIDKTIVYTRQITELEENQIPTFFQNKKGFWRRDESIVHKLNYARVKKLYNKKYPRIEFFIIGFCGKLYVGWKLYSTCIDGVGETHVNTDITYDFDFMKTIMESTTWSSDFEADVKAIQNYDSMHFFRDLKTPVFVFDNDFGVRTYSIEGRGMSKFIVNPLLKNYKFFKIFDTYQAFQEISMFMGGVLGRGEKEIVEVADKYKIQQHGFDKWSFRKEPQSKKK